MEQKRDVQLTPGVKDLVWTFLSICTHNYFQWLLSLDGFAFPQRTWWTDWPQRTWTIRVLDLHGSSNARDFSCKAWHENPSRL